MKKLLFDQDYVRIYLDEQLTALYEEWPQAATQGIQYEDALIQKLRLYKENKGEYRKLHWVNNLTDLHLSDVRAVMWAMRDFHHNMYRAGIRKAAYLIDESSYYHMETRDRLPRPDDADEVTSCFFPSIKEAVEWLDRED